ncbi:hypothetical protein HPP92_010598 [Vanilla planifolia]|uniref:pectinesterase n=1 Tax=Vanilla planifolia TaxID=51239 RepID=A0A835V102_VANPL|nr:hypothetical protein HPP92_010598 [Vanilla planifolia]
MAKAILPLFLVLLLLPTFSFTLHSPPLARNEHLSHGEDFNNWIAWNLAKHRSDQTLRPSSTADRSHGVGMLDTKLAIAEQGRVRYIVSQDGSGDFGTIREAIDSIPLKNTRRVELEIRPGVYREKVVIPKLMSFVTFLGNPEDPPIITGNDTAATKGKDGVPLSTFHSPTVAINADYFLAANIRFENTAPLPKKRQIGGQAVALRISGNKAAFYNCSFYGAQDTLYDHRGLHYFDSCFIQGSMDFIFGYARSLYQNCQMNSIATRLASVTAQKRSIATMESGFSFINGSVTGSGLVYLGRAWGDHSRVVFSYTYMDRVVIPQGWNSWHIHRPERSGVYYGEYRCGGPGAAWAGRVSWARLLTDQEAQPFLGTYYVNGDAWLVGPSLV